MLSIAPVYSTLSTNELCEKVIPAYPIEKIKSCTLWERGFNDTYKIEGESKNYILRIYRSDRRTLDDIEFEVDALLHLKNNNVKVSYPIARKDGNYITPLSTAEGVRFAVITRFAQGEPFTYESQSGDASLYGKHVAIVHSATDGFKSDLKRPKLNEDFLIKAPLASIKNYSGMKHEHKEYINQFALKLSELFPQSSDEKLDYGFCHGDFHGWNAHKTSSDVEFFDFDFCGFGLRSYELSVFRWCAKLKGKENERWEDFISGYRSIRDISEADLALTTAFMAVREIWLMGQRIDNMAVFGRSWMDTKYINKRIKFLNELESELMSV